MFDQILVGVDGQQGGRDATSLAKELASQRSRITLAYVDIGHATAGPGGSSGYSEHRALAVLELARKQAEIEASLRHTVAGSVASGLHRLAKELGSDLLVVGSSRRGLLGRVMLGDDARASLRGARCHVAIAPASYASEPHVMREIGVAYNGSAESEQALAVARRLAAGRGAKVSAFQAVTLPARTYLTGGIPDEFSAEEVVEQARRSIGRLGGVEPHAAFGDPARELALFSASVSLLVVGSRGYGALGRIVHGAISHDLARDARCPLLVLMPAARNPRRRPSPVEQSPDPRVPV